MEEESFELLSSMSPKVKHCQKHFRKGTTILALRKSLQRPVICDRSIHPVNNNKLIITEINSTTTTESNSSGSSNSHRKLLNIVPIIVHDSDSDSNDDLSSPRIKSLEIVKQNEKKCIDKDEECDPLPQEKIENIKRWIDNVEQSKLQDCTASYSVYSELSTIYGENKNFVTERTGQAVNSTVIGSTSVQFDQLFKNKTDISKNQEENFKLMTDEKYSADDSFDKKFDNNISSNQDVIDESYINNQSTNSTKSSQRNKNERYNIKNDTPNYITKNNALKETPKANNFLTNIEKNVDNGNGSESVCDNELASMLDDLYGNKWREKEDHVLPKSEPRKHLPISISARNVNTERKPKLSILYKNPYLETEKLKSNDLLKSLHKSRLNNYIESPALRRLVDFCDSDTDSRDSDRQIYPRAKLNFDSDCDDADSKVVDEFKNNEETKSKYFKDNKGSSGHSETKAKKDSGSDKENFDEWLFLGQTLEERIRKKNCVTTSCGEGGKRKNIQTSSRKTPLTTRSDTGPCKIDKKTETVEEKKVDDRKFSSDSKLSSSSDDEWENEISKVVQENKQIDGKYSFLASLSANTPIYQCDMSARIYRNNFKPYKDQLLIKLFKLFNEKVFENALPQNTLLEWNDRMRGTAGFCYCKKITKRTGAVERTARIVLSTKVIDSASRLRDTLIHEMCHAAAWIVNCVSDGHGPYWKSWALKAMQTFPELPPIKRCHDYVINTKYTYKCTDCGYSIGRHTKSLDIERKRCGHCFGKFEVLLNKVSKKGETKSVPVTPKKEVTGFALFVKENYGVYKQGNLKHADVMKLLGQKFQEMKLKPK